jgi:hypothetical protein
MVNETERYTTAATSMCSKLDLAAACSDNMDHAQLMLDASLLMRSMADAMFDIEAQVNQLNVMVQRLLASP